MNTHRSVQHLNQEIFYSFEGTGPVVVLLHGFGEDSTIWMQQVAFLKSDFTVITPDIPGSGKSPYWAKDGVSIDDYADCVKAILDCEKISRCILIGHSMGGYISLAFAEKYPAKLKALGLVHSTAYADSEEKKQARQKSISFIRENGSMEFLKTAIPGLFHDQEKNKHQINGLISSGKNFKPEALVQYYEAMIARPDRTNVLRELNIPLLFVMGKFDNAVPISQSLEQSYLSPNTHIHILRNSAHMGMIEEMKLLNDIFGSFLA